MITHITKEINNIMYAIKPRKRYKGYYQAIKTIEICCTNVNALSSLDKEVYPVVALGFECNPKSIEKNIRMFLDNIDYSKLSQLLDVEIIQPMEVKEFIYLIVAYVNNKYMLYTDYSVKT